MAEFLYTEYYYTVPSFFKKVFGHPEQLKVSKNFILMNQFWTTPVSLSSSFQDVAARGLDVPTADCIVQYTGPQTDEDYLHRVGRTGRAGKSGSAIIFLTHEEQDYITRLQEHKVL